MTPRIRQIEQFQSIKLYWFKFTCMESQKNIANRVYLDLIAAAAAATANGVDNELDGALSKYSQIPT